MFVWRMLIEKYRESQIELHCVFEDLKKAYDRLLREELSMCMRRFGVTEKYVRLVQDIYDSRMTMVRFTVGVTDGFKVDGGLHQGSGLSPFLFSCRDGQTDR